MDFEYENLALQKGYKFICGVDEAGRGPLAGPVSAAAVILPMNCEIDGLNDSKKLSGKKREILFDIIIEKAISYSIAFCDEREIDEINILNATFKAMKSAVEGLKVPADYCIVDGNFAIKELSIPCEPIIKGDAKSMSIAAASILAKVSRDRFMLEMDEKYPQYNFKKHKGYGTAEHIEMIKTHGASEIHRKSFLKNILSEQNG